MSHDHARGRDWPCGVRPSALCAVTQARLSGFKMISLKQWNQGKWEYRFSVLFTLCTKSIKLPDEVDCRQRLILIVSLFIVIFLSVTWIQDRRSRNSFFIYFLQVFKFLFALYVVNVLFCYTRATVLAALCVSMVTVRGRACLSHSGVHFPKATWLKVPSLPKEFSATCNHSWLSMLFG